MRDNRTIEKFVRGWSAALRISRRWLLPVAGMLLSLAIACCQGPGKQPGSAAGNADALHEVIADFEHPNPPVSWVPLASATMPPAANPGEPETQPATQFATQSAAETQPTTVQRSSVNPQAGLWALAANVTDSGAIKYSPPKPLDLGKFNQLSVQVSHAAAPVRNGQCIAFLSVTDADGKTAQSDAYAVVSRWQPIAIDLGSAFNQGVDISRIASIAINIHCTGSLAEALMVQTDTWIAEKTARKAVVGNPQGAPKSFFVESDAARIHVGSVGQYEMILSDHGATPPAVLAAADAARGRSPSPSPPPWIEVFIPSPFTDDPPKKVLGQAATGLFLLDQSGLDAINPFRRQTPDDAPAPATSAAPAQWSLPATSWPASIRPDLTRIQWVVAWTSSVAAIIEGTQECGPYDRLGEPAVLLRWRLMIYQWGQVFVHVQWTLSGEETVPEPVTWALVLDDGVIPQARATSPQMESSEQRLLTDIYPATLRQGMQAALPHRMQTGAPVAMIARPNVRKDTWWWADGTLTPEDRERRRYIGAGLVSAAPGGGGLSGAADCMLLVNDANALTKAASFGQYAVPAKVVVKQGELDRNFPGDVDNDGFVESYGFQVVRLANGRASFTIYPQERPIFYPPFLFTVPAVEREALDLKHSRLLINIDGKQFANPPQFPDGSFLLQIPYVLDRPVSVEAILVKQ